MIRSTFQPFLLVLQSGQLQAAVKLSCGCAKGSGWGPVCVNAAVIVDWCLCARLLPLSGIQVRRLPAKVDNVFHDKLKIIKVANGNLQAANFTEQRPENAWNSWLWFHKSNSFSKVIWGGCFAEQAGVRIVAWLLPIRMKGTCNLQCTCNSSVKEIHWRNGTDKKYYWNNSFIKQNNWCIVCRSILWMSCCVYHYKGMMKMFQGAENALFHICSRQGILMVRSFSWKW